MWMLDARKAEMTERDPGVKKIFDGWSEAGDDRDPADDDRFKKMAGKTIEKNGGKMFEMDGLEMKPAEDCFVFFF